MYTILTLSSVSEFTTSSFPHLEENGWAQTFPKHSVSCWSQETNKCHPSRCQLQYWENSQFFSRTPGSNFLSKFILSHCRCICSIAQNAFCFLFFFFFPLSLHALFYLHKTISSQPSVDWDKWNNPFHRHLVSKLLSPSHQFCSPSLQLFPFEIVLPKQGYCISGEAFLCLISRYR